MKKRGQQSFGMSIEMIFSVFLIIVFLAFAILGIVLFLNSQKKVEVELFAQDLQEAVDKSWVSDGGSDLFQYNSLPSEIRYACFVDLNQVGKGPNSDIYVNFRNPNSNLFFYPGDAISGRKDFKINHLDLNISLRLKNPLCFKNENGKVKFYLKKDFIASPLVQVEA